MAKYISDRVQWVGKIDWELKHFHGHELSTSHGSSYNAYLVRDQKTALIDTVWQPYDKEFVARLKEVIDLHQIDYIVMNHNEIDHSGSLPELMREIPNTPIYCTKKGEAIIRGHYHQDWNFVNVKTGDTLCLGETTLTFIEASMLHWPDTMFCYLSQEQILFSNDGFGQHYATESLFNDAVNQDEIYYEAAKYYANILQTYSPLVLKKVKDILAMNLPISMICPSHGVVWKHNPQQIVEKYLQWAANYQENQITLIYDTMWNSTRKMAEAIAEGIRSVDTSITIKLMNAAIDDKNDIVTEVFRSKTILVGSPTVNNGYTHAIAGILELLRGAKFKNKQAAAFGSYGWGGEAVKLISAQLTEAGFSLIESTKEDGTTSSGIRVQWVPTEENIQACRAYGAEIAQR